MADYTGLIVSSADVDLYITPPGVGQTARQIVTASQCTGRMQKNVNNIYAISQEDPISVKGINRQYTGSFTVQSGEWFNLLNQYNALADEQIPSFVDATSGASITVAFKDVANATPGTTSITFLNVLFSEDSFDVNANDPQTLITVNFSASSITRNFALAQ